MCVCKSTPRKLLANPFEKLEYRLALDAPEFSDGEVAGVVEHDDITAASGLVASRQHADVLWLQNDVGDSRLFAVNAEGEHLATLETGVDARDWEDLAIGPGPVAGMDYLYIADTGDNSESRSEVVVYRVAEPDVDSDQSPVSETLAGVVALRFEYPDGPHDAETLIVDPETGDLYLITKRDARSRIYQADHPQSTNALTTLEFAGELTWTAAASGDISPDGDELILKDLHNVYYYSRPEGTSIAEALAATPEELPYISQPLGEGLSFDGDGMGYYTHSEGANQPLYYFERMSTPATGDLNGDGAVNREDVVLLAASFGRSSAALVEHGDLDDDGKVTLQDVAMLQSRLGSSVGSAAAIFAPSEEIRGSLATPRRERMRIAVGDLHEAATDVALASDTLVDTAMRRRIVRRGSR
jgi:hypothetical protein